MTERRNVPEAFVAWLWTQQVGRTLLTTEESVVRVVYPGRRHGSWGPDFHGALLNVDGALVRGDVEIHVRGSGWEKHRHGGDPAYANVVLHVVFEQGPRPLAVGPSGRAIPTVELSPALDSPTVEALLERWAVESPREPALVACLSGAEALARLDRAGLARFRAKAARFEADLACVRRAQALWTGMLEALGYSANVAPFRALAERVPEVEARAITASEGTLVAQAILLGEGGLLPSQRGLLTLDGYAIDLEDAWAATRRSGPRAPLGWRWIGVRPGNGPVRRVAGAAELVADRARWPVEEAVRAALSELPPRNAATALGKLIMRRGSDYWATHSDFGRPLPRPGALLGQERARDAVVNVLLPWIAAVAAQSGEAWLQETAEAIYTAHPRLGSNEITRHMARQILGAESRTIRLNAQRQQGLIHIYRGWCDARDCPTCPAGAAGPPARGGFASGLGAGLQPQTR
jgi:hypothetical protein